MSNVITSGKITLLVNRAPVVLVTEGNTVLQDVSMVNLYISENEVIDGNLL